MRGFWKRKPRPDKGGPIKGIPVEVPLEIGQEIVLMDGDRPVVAFILNRVSFYSNRPAEVEFIDKVHLLNNMRVDREGLGF